MPSSVSLFTFLLSFIASAPYCIDSLFLLNALRADCAELSHIIQPLGHSDCRCLRSRLPSVPIESASSTWTFPYSVRVYRFTSFGSAAKTAFSSRKLVKRQPFCSLFCYSMLFLIQSADLCVPRQIRTATVTPLKRVPLPVGLPGQKQNLFSRNLPAAFVILYLTRGTVCCIFTLSVLPRRLVNLTSRRTS